MSSLIYICDYCGAKLKTEKGFRNHACKKKKLMESIGEVRLLKAYDLFCHWYRRSFPSYRLKTGEEFTKSPYFQLFVDLSEYGIKSEIPSTRWYLDWLINNRIPSRKWLLETTLKEYLSKGSRTEDAVDHAVRSLEKVSNWCDDRELGIEDFFENVPTNSAVKMILGGIISPWLILCSENSHKMLDRFNDEQLDSICNFLDLDYWDKRLKLSEDTANEVREILIEVGV